MMMSQLSRVFFSGLCTFFVVFCPLNQLYAQEQQSDDELTPAEIKRLNDEMNLSADKVNTKNELLAIDSLLMQRELEVEMELFPADDLYGSWSNKHVKAYAGITIPDQYTIDVSSFVMPIKGKVTSKFGKRRRSFHYGTDVKLSTGDTIVAAFDGKVRVKQYERRGYGYYLVLRHPNGLETVYGHLSRFLVDQDQTVKAGEPIGLGGNTGRSTGPHLHFECRFLGMAINPQFIVDFENGCTHDEKYVFNKRTSGRVTSAKYASSTKAKTAVKKSGTTASTKTTATGAVKYHKVRKNETLSHISLRYGVSVTELCRMNGISKRTTLKIGQAIRYS